MSDQLRQPAGSPEGGQFTHTSGVEAQIDLFGASTSPTLRDGLFTVSTIPTDLSDAELEALTAPDAPLHLRAMVAGTTYAGTARRAAKDPDPLVRAIAATSWQLDADEVRELQRQPDVSRALAILLGSGLLGRNPAAPVIA